MTPPTPRLGVTSLTTMTRTLFSGGTVYDGTTGRPAEADVVVEDGRIVDVGPGLDGDEAVDCSGGYLSPGFFDCHVHVVMDAPSQMRLIETPFSLQFYQAAANLKKTLDIGITSVRDAGGADQGVKEAVAARDDPGPAHADLDHHAQPDRRARRRLEHLRGRRAASSSRTRVGPAGSWTGPTRCASGSASSSAPAPT